MNAALSSVLVAVAVGSLPGTLRGFRDAFPRVVSDLYGSSASG